MVYDAKMEYEYGYKTYYLDGESVTSPTFNTKGYTVPYFMNDAGYDARCLPWCTCPATRRTRTPSAAG